MNYRAFLATVFNLLYNFTILLAVSRYPIHANDHQSYCFVHSFMLDAIRAFYLPSQIVYTFVGETMSC